jgi:hypothetical protein
MRRSVKPSSHRRYFLAAPACRVETVVPVRIQQDLRFGRDSVPVSHSSTDENQSEGKSGRGAEQPQTLNTMRRRRKYNLMVRSIRGKSPASHKQPSGHAPQPSSLGASLLLFSSPSLCRKAKPGFCYTMLPVACCLSTRTVPPGPNSQPRTDYSGRGRSAARGRCKPCQHPRGKCRVCTGANIFIIFPFPCLASKREKRRKTSLGTPRIPLHRS